MKMEWSVPAIELAEFERERHAFFLINQNGFWGSQINGSSYHSFMNGLNYHNFFYKFWNTHYQLHLSLLYAKPDNVYYLEIVALKYF